MELIVLSPISPGDYRHSKLTTRSNNYHLSKVKVLARRLRPMGQHLNIDKALSPDRLITGPQIQYNIAVLKIPIGKEFTGGSLS
ncbi:hypothetical protein PGTUg99_011151 [Puccinia graminis f. sp. tritici]|uniref:Uncharacterized protein n=1 Tax=Puccinia graminis f. sp. tritici TaxID=56615 RepID=A0A5B0Q3R1_PUCGR|nr:hypothetical protein PGTUg99_011151 [Puccinia graminis f. sp. tritici]